MNLTPCSSKTGFQTTDLMDQDTSCSQESSPSETLPLPNIESPLWRIYDWEGETVAPVCLSTPHPPLLDDDFVQKDLTTATELDSEEREKKRAIEEALRKENEELKGRIHQLELQISEQSISNATLSSRTDHCIAQLRLADEAKRASYTALQTLSDQNERLKIETLRAHSLLFSLFSLSQPTIFK